MPFTTDFSQFQSWSDGIREGTWLARAIDESLEIIDAGLNVPVDSGRMANAFAMRSPATGAGLMRSGGIGSMEMVGDPGQSAPPKTISKFLEWYRNANR